MDPNSPIKDFMTAFPFTIEKNQTIHEARKLMVENRIRHLPVCEDKNIIGVISERDIYWVLGPHVKMKTENEIKVADIAHDDSYHVDWNTPIKDVVAEMGRRRVGSVFIMREEFIVGIFTTVDVCRCFSQQMVS